MTVGHTAGEIVSNRSSRKVRVNDVLHTEEVTRESHRTSGGRKEKTENMSGSGRLS